MVFLLIEVDMGKRPSRKNKTPINEESCKRYGPCKDDNDRASERLEAARRKLGLDTDKENQEMREKARKMITPRDRSKITPRSADDPASDELRKKLEELMRKAVEPEQLCIITAAEEQFSGNLISSLSEQMLLMPQQSAILGALQQGQEMGELPPDFDDQYDKFFADMELFVQENPDKEFHVLLEGEEHVIDALEASDLLAVAKDEFAQTLGLSVEDEKPINPAVSYGAVNQASINKFDI